MSHIVAGSTVHISAEKTSAIPKTNVRKPVQKNVQKTLVEVDYTSRAVPVVWEQDAVRDRMFTQQDWAVTRFNYRHDQLDVPKTSEADDRQIDKLCQNIALKRGQRSRAIFGDPSIVTSTQQCPQSSVLTPSARCQRVESSTNDDDSLVIVEDSEYPTHSMQTQPAMAAIPTSPYSYEISYSDTVYNGQTGMRLDITMPKQSTPVTRPVQGNVAGICTPPIASPAASGDRPKSVPLAPGSDTVIQSPMSTIRFNPASIARSAMPSVSQPTQPPSQPPTISMVKILSPSELNQRAERMLNNANLERMQSSVIDSERYSAQTPLQRALQSNVDNPRQPVSQPYYTIEKMMNTQYPSPNRPRTLEKQLQNQRPIIQRTPAQEAHPRLPLLPPPYPMQTADKSNCSRSTFRPTIHITLIRDKDNNLDLVFKSSETRILYEDMNENQRLEVKKSLLEHNIWRKMLQYMNQGHPTESTLKLFQSLLPPRETQIFFNTYQTYKASN